MHVPIVQSVLAAGLALTGSDLLKKPAVISEGKILDFAVEKCVDANGEQRCTAPFLVVKNTCYNIEWDTEGTFSHTTAEVKDVKSHEIVEYRDTNGEWTPEKGELVYMDFKPKVPNTGNSTVEYKVTECAKDKSEEI